MRKIFITKAELQTARSPPSVMMRGTEDQHSTRVHGESPVLRRGGKQLYPFFVLMTKLLLGLPCLEIMAPNPLKFMVLLAPLLPLLPQVSLAFIFLNLAFMWKLPSVMGIARANLCQVENLIGSGILRWPQLHVWQLS
ncbi:hypothetical protein SADUNF_Sadunf14G0026700 [Salix dunnii]|uniref:Uncharacterized protein n=1 Tax=Salix dunnii TaxID=1413687 RepID=A0A835MLU8_9ROSI|nr:hypothetical protein SADUNF_Sadunf14G0026700 [Salix dunnii]